MKIFQGGGGRGRDSRPGDWNCSECGATGIFASKSACFKCGADKPGNFKFIYYKFFF